MKAFLFFGRHRLGEVFEKVQISGKNVEGFDPN